MAQSAFLQSVKWCVSGAKEVLNSTFMLTQQLSRVEVSSLCISLENFTENPCCDSPCTIRASFCL